MTSSSSRSTFKDVYQILVVEGSPVLYKFDGNSWVLDSLDSNESLVASEAGFLLKEIYSQASKIEVRFLSPVTIGDALNLFKVTSKYYADLNGERLPYADSTYKDRIGDDSDNDCIGDDGNDRLYGLGGNDALTGYKGRDSLYGGAGEDSIDGGDDSDKLYGGNGNDSMIGGRGDDQSSGGFGDDEFLAGYDDGNDKYVGGGGVDVINYAESGSAVEVSLLSGKASSWGAFSSGVRFVDKLQSIENVVGSKFDDSIFGDSRANVLDGKSGKDVLNGFRGRDQLAGGDDSDLFVFSKTSDTGLGTKADVITDFSSAEGDKIDLSSIDAKRGFTRNDSFTFSDSQPISPGSAALGTVWFVQDTSPVQGSLGGFLLGSTDNDVAPEFAIRVEFKGGQTLISASDVVL